MKINWNRFELKNDDATTAFEAMCLQLFCREFNVDPYKFSNDVNHAGLECRPYEYDGKKIGFQAKYSNSPGLYEQLKTSFGKIKDDVDIIYIYTTKKMNEYKLKKDTNGEFEKTEAVKKVESVAFSKGAKEVIWIVNDALDLAISNHLDILQFFFGEGNEINLINNTLSEESKIFLESKEFIELPLSRGYSLDNICNESDKIITILLGNPGTGKSETLKKIFYNSAGLSLSKKEQIKKIISAKELSVLIDLKLCLNGDLSNTIRTNLGDYYLSSMNCEFEITYLLDGLDELSYQNAIRICNYIKRLACISSTKKIVVSCRTNSMNRSILNKQLCLNEVSIEELNSSYSVKYFEIMGGKKLECFSSVKGNIYGLITDITDIFSIKLLWDFIYEINENTTKIDLVKLKIGSLLRFDEFELNLLDPKNDSAMDLNKDISYIMQKNRKLTISIEEMQKVILGKYNRISYQDTNEIINKLSNAFFMKFEGDDILFTYQHRRYQEYFLYLKIKELFSENPIVLRELNLLSNRDFFLGVFLVQGLKEARQMRNYLDFISLSFLRSYIDNRYIGKYRSNSFIDTYQGYGISEPCYYYSEELIFALGSQDNVRLNMILNDRNMDVQSYFEDEERLLKCIEIFHRYNHQEICSELIMKFRKLVELKSVDINKIVDKNLFSAVYYCGNILGKSSEELKDQFVDNLHFDESFKISMFESTAEIRESKSRAFLKFMIEYRLNELCLILPVLDNNVFSVLCDEMLKIENMFILLDNEEFKCALINKITQIENIENYDFSISILSLLLCPDELIDLSLLEAEWTNVNEDGRYLRWEERWSFNVALSYVLNKEKSIKYDGVKLNVRFFKAIHELLIKDKNITAFINSFIALINETMGDSNINEKHMKRFIYENSKLIGITLAKLCHIIDFHINPALIIRILNSDRIIYLPNVLYTFKKYNDNDFEKIISSELINRLYKVESEDDYYEFKSESELRFAFMQSKLSADDSYSYILKSFNNGILRVNYRNDNLVSCELIWLLESIMMKHWYPEEKIETILERIYKLLNVLEKTTENCGYKENFEKLVSNYTPELCKKFDVKIHEETSVKEDNIVVAPKLILGDYITSKNLYDLYSGKYLNSHKIKYELLSTWEELINKEIELTGKIDILLSWFDESRYPSNNSIENSEYNYLALAAVLKNELFNDEILDYACEKGGRLGIIILTKAYILINDSVNGKDYFERFIKLCELLIMG